MNDFGDIRDLVNIEISPKNDSYSVLDNKYLLKKSDPESQVFDVLIFAVCDIESACIPSYIKKIKSRAFEYCQKLTSITFEPNSTLEEIESYAFHYMMGPEEIVFPPSLEIIGSSALSLIFNLKTITFLSESIRIGNACTENDYNIVSISFPNAEKIKILGRIASHFPDDAKILIKRSAKLNNNTNDIKNQVFYIENEMQIDKI